MPGGSTGEITAAHAPPSEPVSLTAAAEAMRYEEVARTRLFIVMGWAISVAVIGTLYFVDAPGAISIALIVGLVVGFVYSSFLYRAFADPKNYTERSLIGLSIVCVINGHMGLLVFGTYSAAPVVIVVGIHFIGRTELARVARWVFITSIIAYSALAVVIVSGVIDDPGVFASDRDVPWWTLAAATVFVLTAYSLAYYTAHTFRSAAIASIEELQRATRLASQREALMEELRADLERAMQVGGPGHYTERTVGPFKLGVVLGRGAIGEVYAATHLATGAEAAVKVLRREQLTDATQVARFMREVQLMSGLSSPHVVRVMNISIEADELPYLAMERLHGQTLGERLRRDPRMSATATGEMLRQVGLGVDAAAATGIVHRDLKPQNLFQTTDAVWKILDFGVATLGGDTGTLTRGEAVGTPHYMAPEQAQGKSVDTRADIYALGAIAYRCLTGRYPFTAGDTPGLLYAIVHRMPPRPSEVANLSADIDRLFAIVLAKRPEDRFASGAELAAAFDAAIANELDGTLRRRGDALIRKYPWESA
jgi:eukaryotic-like serine/threonine-protein kinase